MNTMKKKYKIEGLTCASCAIDLEKQFQKVIGMTSVYLDFASSKLIVEGDKNAISLETLEKLSKTIGHPIVLIDDEHTTIRQKTISLELWINILGVNLFLLAIIGSYQTWFDPTLLYLISYLLIGGKVIYRAIRNMFKGHFFDEHFLMTIATLGAIGIGEMIEAVAVMLFYRIGEFLQEVSVNRSRKSIQALMDIKPEIAHLYEHEEIKDLHPKLLHVNDIILVRIGERIPVDGTIIMGQSTLDLKSLTGESMPKDVGVDTQVYSGSLNLTGLLKLRVDKPFEESMATKIVQFVEDNQFKKAKTETFITRFSKIYTPVVVGIAIMLAFGLPLMFSLSQPGNYRSFLPNTIQRALILLVISCPCALVLSIPLSYFAGIGASSKEGMLFKGGADLENLEKIGHFIFDKTGTLTKGIFEVTEIHSDDPETLLEVVANIESHSNHPIAQSILRHYSGQLDPSKVKNFEEIHGQGVKAFYEGVEVFIGNQKMIEQKINIANPALSMGTLLYVSTKSKLLGYIVLEDQVKPSTQSAIQFLKDQGKMISMITGDSKKVATHIGNELGIDKIYSEQLPHEKAAIIDTLKIESKVAFIGDGMNDAPVLIKADLGIAMGGIGSDATIEASDAVLMNDQLSTLVKGYKISVKTKRVITENIIFILGMKGLIMILGALGYASLWLAIFADVGVALIAVVNTMKILKK